MISTTNELAQKSVKFGLATPQAYAVLPEVNRANIVPSFAPRSSQEMSSHQQWTSSHQGEFDMGLPANSTQLASRYLSPNPNQIPLSPQIATNNPSSRNAQLPSPSMAEWGTHTHSSSHFAAPTKTQLAARHVMSRDLPHFSGDPHDWPLFYKSFCNSTAACGLSDAENLDRLQKCLKGRALEAVRSKLLIPDSVPQVMNTLKMLFGQPEIILFTVLKKLRETPGPKYENLQSIITFGLAVQNAVDHMVTADLTDHLFDPMLLYELVVKLPTPLAIEWGRFKRQHNFVNLAVFNKFMSELVTVSSDISIPIPVSKEKHAKSFSEKSKLYVHSENSTINSDQSSSQVLRGKHTVKTTNPKAQIEKTCVYCQNPSHEIAKCQEFISLDLDRKWFFVKQKHLCYLCLVPHKRWPCRSGKECGIGGCRLRHNVLLHADRNSTNNSNISTSDSALAQQNHHHSSISSALFRYLPVVIEGRNRSIETFAFLDDGSSSTLLEANIAKELGIEGTKETLWLSWTGNVSREEKGSQRVSVSIRGKGCKTRYEIGNVRTVSQLKLTSQTIDYEDLQKRYPHLKGLPVMSYAAATPGIIVGLEHVSLLTQLKVREGGQHDLVAAKTRLGWCIFGKQGSLIKPYQQLHVHSDIENENKEFHTLLGKFFGVEEAFVSIKPESKENKQALDILARTTRRVDGHFETGLLWRFSKPNLPNSYPMAIQRNRSFEKRLCKNDSLKAAVEEQIENYLEKGYAHLITKEELASSDNNRVWYLPLGVVCNPKKPGKTRLIWDAAARVDGTSLNDLLLPGPDLLVSLPAILLRFRQRNVAVCGDIKEMFHQIRIRAEDRQAQRFIYRKAIEDPIQIYVMDVAVFGASCSPCIAQFIKNYNAIEHSKQFPEAAHAIVNDHYMDDYMKSVDSVAEAVKLANDVKTVHAMAGFELRNFISNSSEVMRELGVTSCPEMKSLSLEPGLAEPEKPERVLGMTWRPGQDVLLSIRAFIKMLRSY
ncbi:uncharacterized protein LOC129753946 [Uranotaenia lowii]|uniref:uncharacterized protein LOC129753946 n=1 Tax=Uranotaenia lowii TaxID=190385 RepID=UPI002479B19D|nr:uncharacterized protein LOC129753946 [Uranotaenia lowii]